MHRAFAWASAFSRSAPLGVMAARSCHCSPYVLKPVSKAMAAKARTESSAELPQWVSGTVVPLLSVRAQTGFESHSGKGTYGKQC
jgi:hypothetical protein